MLLGEHVFLEELPYQEILNFGLNKIVEARTLVNIGLASLVGFKNLEISFTKVKLVEVVVLHRYCYV